MSLEWIGTTTFEQAGPAVASVNEYGLDEVRRTFTGKRADLATFLATVRKDMTDSLGLRVKEQPEIQNVDGRNPTVIVTYVGRVDTGAPLSVVAITRRPLTTFSYEGISFEYHSLETTYTYAISGGTRPIAARYTGATSNDANKLKAFNILPYGTGPLVNLMTINKVAGPETKRMGAYWGCVETWTFSIQVQTGLTPTITFSSTDSGGGSDPDAV